ncbi:MULTISPECIES: 3-hydroxyisobutyrate dehydrogenase [Vibrio]|uniref:3-hydroxyisobutyrate dehydrogenase n=2 Tax=Vibrio TaxID=662 RepID=A0A7X4RW55_9VIBR|nr:MULTISPECIES: 3-hydroxyisobutyrate dehydrogenase [Vibrio]MBF9003553.1 3-hydroxyisobutyrate dehydrogenase [Vibrio nitrifigilis]MZI95020.1 3-hydroxyisobutyrate dehydrogenase [Vibrio eleionomae]
MTQLTIGFIGLGNMGGPMASNLAKAGYNVVGFDVNPEAITRATENGVQASDSLLNVASSADIIFTMLPNGKFVKEVWEQIIDHVKPTATLVDTSTADVETSKLVHELAKSHGVKSVDAPVSGGVTGAQNAKLTFMVGGEQDAIDVVLPLLDIMGQKAVNCGGPGAGQSAKICNNLILGINIVAVSEAFALAEKLGLSSEALFDVASTSTGQCWALTTYCPVPGLVPTSPSNNNYKPGAPATMLLKDLRLAQDAAKSSDACTPLGNHTIDIFEDFIKDGFGEQDFSAIIKYIRANQAK